MIDESTKQRLARVLAEEGLAALAERALRGIYDDYESPHNFPLHVLVHDLREALRPDLAQRVMAGEWDCTVAEGQAWAKREGIA